MVLRVAFCCWTRPECLVVIIIKHVAQDTQEMLECVQKGDVSVKPTRIDTVVLTTWYGESLKAVRRRKDAAHPSAMVTEMACIRVNTDEPSFRRVTP